MNIDDYFIAILEEVGDGLWSYNILCVYPITPSFQYHIPEADRDRPNLKIRFVHKDHLNQAVLGKPISKDIKF